MWDIQALQELVVTVVELAEISWWSMWLIAVNHECIWCLVGKSIPGCYQRSKIDFMKNWMINKRQLQRIHEVLNKNYAMPGSRNSMGMHQLKLNLNMKRFIRQRTFCTNYSNSQRRLPSSQDTLIRAHVHRLHKGHLRSEQGYAVSLFYVYLICYLEYGHSVTCTNVYFKRIDWTSG